MDTVIKYQRSDSVARQTLVAALINKMMTNKKWISMI